MRRHPLERPLFWCKRGGLTKGVLLYQVFSVLILTRTNRTLTDRIHIYATPSRNQVAFSHLRHPLFQLEYARVNLELFCNIPNNFIVFDFTVRY